MSDKRETVADIVAEMRSGLNKSWHDIDREWARSLPDRIEAAEEVELRQAMAHGQSHAEKVAAANCRDCVLRDSNPAAMREALVRLQPLAHVVWNGGGAEDVIAEIAEMVDIIDAALAAPPRNCDKFLSFEEALAAWRETSPYVSGCFDEWLFAPANESEVAK